MTSLKCKLGGSDTRLDLSRATQDSSQHWCEHSTSRKAWDMVSYTTSVHSLTPKRISVRRIIANVASVSVDCTWAEFNLSSRILLYWKTAWLHFILLGVMASLPQAKYTELLCWQSYEHICSMAFSTLWWYLFIQSLIRALCFDIFHDALTFWVMRGKLVVDAAIKEGDNKQVKLSKEACGEWCNKIRLISTMKHARIT